MFSFFSYRKGGESPRQLVGPCLSTSPDNAETLSSKTIIWGVWIYVKKKEVPAEQMS